MFSKSVQGLSKDFLCHRAGCPKYLRVVFSTTVSENSSPVQVAVSPHLQLSLRPTGRRAAGCALQSSARTGLAVQERTVNESAGTPPGCVHACLAAACIS